MAGPGPAMVEVPVEMSKDGQRRAWYAGISTPLGGLFVAQGRDGICCAAQTSSARDFERACLRGFGVRPTRDVRLRGGLAKQIADHVTGKRAFSGALDLSGLTQFRRRVLRKVCEIPFGEVRSYQWVAKEIGSGRAVRAVGTALARNPIPFVIPCHRVVRTDGRIGQYSAGGPSMKAKILAFEGVDLDGLARLAARRIRLVGNKARKVLCLPTCHAGKRIGQSRAVYFSTIQDTIRQGYRSCRHCRPT